MSMSDLIPNFLPWLIVIDHRNKKWWRDWPGDAKLNQNISALHGMMYMSLAWGMSRRSCSSPLANTCLRKEANVRWYQTGEDLHNVTWHDFSMCSLYSFQALRMWLCHFWWNSLVHAQDHSTRWPQGPGNGQISTVFPVRMREITPVSNRRNKCTLSLHPFFQKSLPLPFLESNFDMETILETDVDMETLLSPPDNNWESITYRRMSKHECGLPPIVKAGVFLDNRCLILQ